ncbi:Sensor histidine kinase RcsC [subsurface metagenome]
MKRKTLEEVFRDVVALIPPAWQYPEITRARLRFDKAGYVSEPFKETEWKQSSDIIVGGERRGTVEVYYLESRPELDEGPFLKEERQLIDGIATTLGEAIEHRRTEEKIRQAAEEWRTTFDSISDFVSLHGKDYKVVRANKALADALKMKPGELVGKHCYELIHGTKEPHPDCPYEQVQKTKKPSTVEFFEPSLGMYIQCSLSHIINEKGECTGTVHIIKDITERKQAEEALRESQEYAKNIIDSSLDMIVAVDNKRRITEFNHAAEDAFGYHRDEVIGKHINILYENPKEGLAVHKQTIVSGHHVQEILNRHRNGKTFPSMISSSVLRDSSGEVVGVMGVSRDITERKLAEETLQKAHDELEMRVEERTADLAIANKQLQKAKETAEIATQAKSDFLAGMSHELRTPLNAIIGFSEILSDQTFGELNQKQLKYTNHVLTSGRHLLALINDILDLSKVEAGKMELELSTVAIGSLLEDSLVMIKEKAYIHRISLDLRIPDELSDLKFQADERKLKQIMFNLLSNAVKFTPDGGTITVEGRQEKDELVVAFSDTGIGIKHEDLERVFGEFEQIDSTHARKQQGTGLGLALTRRMVELHGGRIRAESEGEGKGSTFTFVIPVETE